MARTTQKVFAVFAFAVVVLAISIALVALRDSGTALPNPNGYDDFVKSGRMVTTSLGSLDLGDYREFNTEALSAFSKTNAEALKIARCALDRQCRVPIENNVDWFRAHLGEMVAIKNLTRVFLVAGRLAQLEGQTNHAVDIYLDSIRLAHESTRGGLIVETAIARVQEALGLEGLKSVSPALDAAQCRRIAAILEELDARQESWEAYFRRDVRYALRAEIKSLFSLDNWRTQQSFKTRFYQAQLLRRQTLLTFAARAYELETGTKPSRLAVLVPAYLQTILQDPLTRTDLALPP